MSLAQLSSMPSGSVGSLRCAGSGKAEGVAGTQEDTSDSVLRTVIPVVRERLGQLGARTRERLRTELASYADLDPDELLSSVTGQFEYLFSSISGTPWTHAETSGPAATGRRRAEQWVPLHEVLEAYRITVAELWQEVQQAAMGRGSDPRVVVELAGEMFGRLEEVSRIAVVAHRDRSAELLVEAEAERGATLEALFTGILSGRDEIWRAAARLDLPYEGRFVAVAAEATAAADPLAGVHGQLRTREFGSVWRLTPDLKIGLVSLRRHEVATLVSALEEVASGRVGISTVFDSLDGASRGVYLARLMMGSVPAGQVAVRLLADTPLAALLVASPETARTLIHSVLEPVLTQPAKNRELLLDTLNAWLGAKGNVAAAGQVLFCHPNTVRYRMNRVQELLGQDLTDPAALVEVTAAVQALRLFPVGAPH